MNVHRNGTRRGFSLVELLAVVMILGVLAAIAVPLYLNSRKAAAARTCLANIAAMAAAESAFAVRNGQYTSDPAANVDPYLPLTPTAVGSGLVGAPEGLSFATNCPLNNGTTYAFAGGGVTAGVTNPLTISCGNAITHATYVGVAGNYTVTLVAPAVETAP